MRALSTMFDKGRNIWLFSCSVHSMYSLIIGFLYKHSPGPSISYFRLLKYLFYCFQFLPGSNHTGKTPWGEKITRKHNSAPSEIWKKHNSAPSETCKKQNSAPSEICYSAPSEICKKNATVRLMNNLNESRKRTDNVSDNVTKVFGWAWNEVEIEIWLVPSGCLRGGLNITN